MENYARLYHILDRLGSIIGNKSLQKIIYLIQSPSHDLGYKYEWGISGPVSPKLENDIYEAVSLGIIHRELKNGFPLYSCNYDLKSKYVINKIQSIQLSNEIDSRLTKIIALIQSGELKQEYLEIVASLDFLSQINQYSVQKAKEDLLVSSTIFDTYEYEIAETQLAKITA